MAPPSLLMITPGDIMGYFDNTVTQDSQASVSHAAMTSVATILPTDTAMPLECDSCDSLANYSITFLRTLPKLVCQCCGDARQFSQIELTVLEQALKNMGFYLPKNA